MSSVSIRQLREATAKMETWRVRRDALNAAACADGGSPEAIAEAVGLTRQRVWQIAKDHLDRDKNDRQEEDA